MAGKKDINYSRQAQIIKAQEQSGNTKLYLVRNGAFYHAVNGAAFALGWILDNCYVYERVHADGEKVYTLGFPVKNIDAVLRKMKDCGLTLYETDEAAVDYIFTGGNTEYSQELIDRGKEQNRRKEEERRRRETNAAYNKMQKTLALRRLEEHPLPSEEPTSVGEEEAVKRSVTFNAGQINATADGDIIVTLNLELKLKRAKAN